jgi:putative membrane protein
MASAAAGATGAAPAKRRKYLYFECVRDCRGKRATDHEEKEAAMRLFLIHWMTLAVALAATAWLLPGVRVDSPASLLVAALVLGFLNAILKPLLVLLTLPITVMTLGLFYFVLNGILFALASVLVPGFEVSGLGSAVLGAIVMGLISMFIGAFTREKRR